MLKKYIFYLFILLNLQIFAAHDQKPTLRTLIMCDNLSSNIKKASFMDLEKMKKVTNVIAKNLKMKQKTTILKGKKLAVQPFSKWIESLSISPNDVVIFYYSGHGFHKTEDESPWPSFFLKSARKNLFIVTGDKIYEHLKQKPTQFTLVLFDCCNYDLSLKERALISKEPFSIPKGPLPGFRTLFAKSHGMVTISAASRGEFGIAITGGKNVGSIFTTQFLSVLLQVSKREDASWREVVKRTTHKCANLSDKSQNPIGLIELSNSL